MPNNIAVSITADVADLQVKRAVMSAELKAATKDLNAFAKEAAASGSTAALREGMLASAAAAEKARNSIALVNTQLKELAATATPAVAHVKDGFGSASIGIREFGGHIRESITMVGEMREAMVAFGEVMIAAFALERIHQWAEGMGDAAEKTVHLAETFGMTVGQVQQLQGIAKATGMDVAVLTKGMGILDKNMVNAAGTSTTAGRALKAVGIAANDSRTQMQLLEAVADKFKNMDDGPKKVALSMALFGKSGKDLIPILNMGADGLAEFNRKSAEYGAINEVAVGKGMALADSMDEQKIAMQGVSNVMMDAFAPVLKDAADGLNEMIKSMVDSYTEGGLMKTVLDDIGIAAEGAGSLISNLIGLIGDLGDIFGVTSSEISSDLDKTFARDAAQRISVFDFKVQQLKATFVELRDIIDIVCIGIRNIIDNLAEELKRDCEVMYDALTLDWGSIIPDWEAGTNQIVKVNADAASRVKTLWADAMKQENAQTNTSHIGDDKYDPHALDGIMGKNKAGGGGDLGFQGGGGGGGHHPKEKKDPGLAQQWKASLATMLADEASWGKDEAKLALTFWESKLILAKKGSKDEAEVLREIARAKLTIHKEEMQNTVAGIKQREALESEAAKTDIELAKIGLQNKLQLIDQEEARHEITATQAAQRRAALNAQLAQLDVDMENREYQIKQAAIAKEFQLEHQSEKVRGGLRRQRELLFKQHQDNLVKLNAKANQQMIADNAKVNAARTMSLRQLQQSWSQSLSQMMTGQVGFFSGIKNLWQGLQNFVASLLSQIVEQWLIQHGVMTAIGKLFGIHDVSTSAGRAAAAAYASTAAIPIIGPALAPAAAATAGAGALSMGMAFGSAEGGDWQVRPGMYELHKDEMVLPAWAAQPLRNMVSSGASGGGFTPSAANDKGGGLGDLHVHVSAFDAHGVKRLFMDHKGPLAQAVKKYARDGGR